MLIANFLFILQNMFKEKPTISIIIPARNETGNIDELVRRIPTLPAETEIIFVEGHSQDNTYQEIEKVVRRYSDRQIRYTKQSGYGKADAVWTGFDMAKGEILMILDADISVTPEDLPTFYQAILINPHSLVIGTRLVHAIEPGAMRFINYCGNRLFAFLFRIISKQKITDALCGTKVLRKSAYQAMRSRPWFQKIDDPFGDFSLLLGAVEQGLKIVELPIYYRRRQYGKTQIRRFQDGFKLFKIIWQYYLQIAKNKQHRL